MRVSWPVLTARSWLAAILSLDLLFVSVSAIRCLQCTSLKQRECESGDLSATECPDQKDRYCTKITGDSGSFVYRSCSKTEMTLCERKEVSGIDMKICFHTCDTDGCNAAMTVTSLPPAMLVVVALVCVAVALELTVEEGGAAAWF